MSCNVKECEEGSNVIYCPNRFTFDEMCNIKMSLCLAPQVIKGFIESVEDYESLSKEEKAMFDNGKSLIKQMGKLEKKVNRLVGYEK
ncbi:hypothetical protein [Clostridium autoethanogenum]|uniref:Uncharacterized protein n=1 Tax=Clostridium autoethanogenum DSM 10061 TaxID=1341692 RepID=A0ABY4TVL1_9CLOT|nr:hypothetical protein [Clostridium autoethanogenum]OVY48498.1 hypothetical protein WX72_00591 [Clostridium autoethanogenum]OVY48505.1 hypothetical protein WX72_00598 [Clostridium autoethanogenum]URS74512.1 hypothetical protein CAETHG_05095 [Clostridium autoethanogenum DSM 10061]